MTARLVAATRAFRRAKVAHASAHAELVEAIVEAAAAGEPQVRIVEATGYTREHIRRLVAEARGSGRP